MKTLIEKSGETRLVKDRYLQNFLDQGWKAAKVKKSAPAVKVEATADVISDEPEWDMSEDWADSEESKYSDHTFKGEA